MRGQLQLKTTMLAGTGLKIGPMYIKSFDALSQRGRRLNMYLTPALAEVCSPVLKLYMQNVYEHGHVYTICDEPFKTTMTAIPLSA